jgi:hypothetical protein
MSKAKIIEALERARALAPDHESACAAVAQSLGVPVETVREVAAEPMADCDGELA